VVSINTGKKEEKISLSTTKEGEKQNWKVPLFKMYSDKEDINSISAILKRGMQWAEGPEIKEFEEKVSNYLENRNSLSFNSGTSALHVLLSAYNIKNKEVITPSFTFIATANAIPMARGIPVFADIEEKTLGLDAKDVENRITEKTKAIILVHYGGQPAKDTEKIRRIAEENDILLIEDAAEAFGATINQKKVGTFGHGAMFSLCQSKIITTGEGGLAITDDKKVLKTMRLIRSHGREDNNYFDSEKEPGYIQIGHNFRLPTISAALGISQLNKIDKIINMRIKCAEQYNNQLSKIKELKTPEKIEGFKNVYQLYTLKLNDKETRDSLQNFLQKNGIMTKVFFSPIHLSKYYRERYKYREGVLPITEKMYERVLTLPMFPHIKKQEINYTTGKIKEFFDKK
jgi:perosamine synthetase